MNHDLFFVLFLLPEIQQFQEAEVKCKKNLNKSQEVVLSKPRFLLYVMVALDAR